MKMIPRLLFKWITCPACGGSGLNPKGTGTCPVCRGSGQIEE
jgi:DnaJ-class molecular chaperone